MKKILIMAAVCLALGAVGYWGIKMYGEVAGVHISGHGFAAMAIGLILTLVVGIGLMALLFFSNKHGHDEIVYHLHDKTPDDQNINNQD